jgi:hypothetical protein
MALQPPGRTAGDTAVAEASSGRRGDKRNAAGTKQTYALARTAQ